MGDVHCRPVNVLVTTDLIYLEGGKRNIGRSRMWDEVIGKDTKLGI